MSFDFDQVIDRSGTQALKYALRQEKFGRADVVPLWIADMDLAAPPCVTAALAARAAHPIYGYTTLAPALLEAAAGWHRRRHGWTLPEDAIMPVSGVASALSVAVEALTAPGDGVIVQPPVYPGFFQAIETTGRHILANPLRERDGHWEMDLEQLEQLARGGARTLLLCNPHNPVGRAWSAQELAEVLRIARRHDLTLISDEVHGDLALPGHAHVPLARLAENDPRVASLVSPGKTFNLQGLPLALLVVPDPARRALIQRVVATWRLGDANAFSVVAAEAAWRGGDAWLDALKEFLDKNRRLVEDQIAHKLPSLRVAPIEASYLAWLDCRTLGLDDAALQRFFVEDCGLGLNPGIDFGTGGAGHMRMNIAAPWRTVVDALGAVGEAMARLPRRRG